MRGLSTRASCTCLAALCAMATATAGTATGTTAADTPRASPTARTGTAAAADTVLDPTRARRVAALVGGLVADAAAMPLHWIYDTAAIAQILAKDGRAQVRTPRGHWHPLAASSLHS